MKEITVPGIIRGSHIVIGYKYEATEEDNNQCYLDVSEKCKKNKHVQIFTGEAIFRFTPFMDVLRQSLEKGKPRVQVFCYNPEFNENLAKSRLIENANDSNLVNKAIKKGVLEVFWVNEPIKQHFALIGNATLWIQRVHDPKPGRPKSMLLLPHAKDVMKEYKREAAEIKDKIIGKLQGPNKDTRYYGKWRIKLQRMLRLFG